MNEQITKVIFLDFDGVLTCPRVLSWYNLDIYAVNFFRWVCEQCGAKIVISSTWRHSHNKQYFQAIFDQYLHDDWKTPDWRRHFADARGDRGEEIDIWLNGIGEQFKDKISPQIYDKYQGHKEVNQYIIIDDDNDILKHQLPFFIQTDSLNGLLNEHQMKIKNLWSIEGWPKEIKELYQHPYMFATYNLKSK